MLPLEGETLGEKHKHFNKLLQDALAKEQFNLTKINSDESDIHNLLKIEIACKIKDIDYIIDVLKCEDMLYISRAIKRSTWLITEQEYEHIINPEYLHTQLFPFMLTKAVNKLLLHVRLHLKDEKRVEAFYDYFKDASADAHKWLSNCSIDFIENEMKNQQGIPLQTYKRLCKRSVKFLQYYTSVQENKHRVLKEVMFLIKSHTEEYLNVYETIGYCWLPWITKKSTKIIMKQHPSRILNNFQRYAEKVDLSTIAKHLKKEEIKDFLLKHIRQENIKNLLLKYEKLKHFMEYMPEHERFGFVKEAFLQHGLTLQSGNELDCAISCVSKLYQWYRFAPFDEAFIALENMIRLEDSHVERYAMLSVLITCAKNNPQNTKTLLQYFHEKHRNEQLQFKIQFITNVITQMATHNFDTETWNIMDQLLRSINVYTKPTYNLHMCLEAIILYKILHNENVPEIVKENISVEAFNIYQDKLNDEQKSIIFCYLIKSLLTKFQNITILNESDFNNAIDILKEMSDLWLYWNKNITDYTFIIDYVKELIKIKRLKENSWNKEKDMTKSRIRKNPNTLKIKLSSLYNSNKSWRRYMFEESIALNPCEEVCLNALKHDPELLKRHTDEMLALKSDRTVSLQRLHTKLRVYWSQSLAQEWTNSYLNRINNKSEHKSIIRGLFALLPQKQFIDLAKRYTPKDETIDRSKVNKIDLSLSKNIAGNMHMARPLASLDTLLCYSKGAYVKYTEPSLNAILYNISRIQSQAYISKLIEAPITLKKYGINLAFMKLNYKEIKIMLSAICKSTSDSTIHAHLLTHTYNYTCKTKDPLVVVEMCDLLSIVFENLSSIELKVNFNKLTNVANLPAHAQGKFYMQIYEYLTTLPTNPKYKTHINNLIRYAPSIMDMLDTEFVADKLLAPAKEQVSKCICPIIHVTSSYVLHGKTEEEQCDRFRKSLAPALEHAFIMKYNIDALLGALITDFVKFTLAKKILIPIQLFSEIQYFMRDKMCLRDYYVQYARWQLFTDYVSLLNEHKSMLSDPKLGKFSVTKYNHGLLPLNVQKIFEEIHTAILPKFGPIIVEHLKDDTEKYSPSIILLFIEALRKMLDSLFFSKGIKLASLKFILHKDCIPSYLVVCQLLNCYEDHSYSHNPTEIGRKLHELLSAHPSKEVQMHYHRTLRHRLN